jgi:4-amino-4-deoxy-L-arabinose transferase-like glycosyltransferase
MDIEIDKPTEGGASEHIPVKPSSKASQYIQQHQDLIDMLVMAALALAALIPRIIMATQLDMVTDEVVYILGGKIYLPLATHLSVGAKGWMYNYEHPPFVKLLIGLSMATNDLFGHPLSTLFAARIPSILFGTLLAVSIYWLGKAPFGRIVTLAAALCLAFSPWLVYFSGLAYLDMTMTALITVAYLLAWHAIKRPWLYIVIALLIGLGCASKYTASLAIPSLLLFTAYYFFVLRSHLPREQRPPIPWQWWIAAIVASPLIFLAVDMAIWPSPISLLTHSFLFEWNHSVNGHLTFLAGQYGGHVPHWSILYILLVKISALTTVPAIFFAIYSCVQLVRFHWPESSVEPEQMARIAFVFIWLVSIVGMFSLLNIVVGTHYHLPAAPPIALAGACGMAIILRALWGYCSSLFDKFTRRREHEAHNQNSADTATPRAGFNLGTIIIPVALIALLAIPHLIGVITVPDAEGYTSVFFQGEDGALQVAYPGYRDAVQWLATYTHKPARIGLVALPYTLNSGGDGISWYDFNKDLPKRFTLAEAHPQAVASSCKNKSCPVGLLAQAHPQDQTYPYNYLVWPMHLVQRGYAIPEPWRSHVIHIVKGGDTIYCYILANPANGTP